MNLKDTSDTIFLLKQVHVLVLGESTIDEPGVALLSTNQKQVQRPDD